MLKPLIKLVFSSLVLVVGLSGCMASRSLESSSKTQIRSFVPSSQFISSTSRTISLQKQEELILKKINQHRRALDLSPLELDERISQKAREHSQSMAERHTEFGHDGFDQRVEAIELSIPYRSAAENVAFNQGHQKPAIQAIEGWLKSPSHLTNIEGDFNLTGIGVMSNQKGEYFFTQIFIKEP